MMQLLHDHCLQHHCQVQKLCSVYGCLLSVIINLCIFTYRELIVFFVFLVGSVCECAHLYGLKMHNLMFKIVKTLYRHLACHGLVYIGFILLIIAMQ